MSGDRPKAWKSKQQKIFDPTDKGKRGGKVSCLIDCLLLHGPAVWKVADRQDRIRKRSLRKRCTDHLHHSTQTQNHVLLCASFASSAFFFEIWTEG